MTPEFTPEKITSLKPYEVFVFGTRLNGAHNSGAARVARDLFGAVPGCGTGFHGQSYAIPTMQGGVETIRPYVDEFIEFARNYPQLKFYVTRIGCGKAGFTDLEIAPLFNKAFDLENVILPKSFWEIIHHGRQVQSETLGMKFTAIRIKFYDEDIAKMEKMSQDEKIAYATHLRQEGKYIVLN